MSDLTNKLQFDNCRALPKSFEERHADALNRLLATLETPIKGDGSSCGPVLTDFEAERVALRLRRGTTA